MIEIYIFLFYALFLYIYMITYEALQILYHNQNPWH